MDAHISERVRANALEVEGEWWVLELRAMAKLGDELSLAVLEHIAHIETRPPSEIDWEECPVCGSLSDDLEVTRDKLEVLEKQHQALIAQHKAPDQA